METEFGLPPGMQLKYLRSRLDDLAKISSPLTDAGREELKIISHKMRGNAATFGLPKLGSLAAEIEDILNIEPLATERLELLAIQLKQEIARTLDLALQSAEL